MKTVCERRLCALDRLRKKERVVYIYRSVADCTFIYVLTCTPLDGFGF